MNYTEKPPRPVVTMPPGIRCRGCYIIGTACGKCESCLQQWNSLDWDEILLSGRKSHEAQETKTTFKYPGMGVKHSEFEAHSIPAPNIEKLILDIMVRDKLSQSMACCITSLSYLLNHPKPDKSQVKTATESAHKLLELYNARCARADKKK